MPRAGALSSIPVRTHPPTETMTPKLRPACPEDSAFVYRVKKASLGEYIHLTWGWDEELQQALHAKRFDPAAIQIISCGRTDVGWVEVDRRHHDLRLAGIYILPDHQGWGTGTAVIHGLLAEASVGQRAVTLQVLKVNRRARMLYERLGFVTTGESATHYHMSLRP